MTIKLIDYFWYHAVNDQLKLNNVMKALSGQAKQLQAIEADIIYSESKSQAVMGHPPLTDSDLSLSSLLQQVKHINFQSPGSNLDSSVNILKMDFKSMKALKSSMKDIKEYLEGLPPQLHQYVWLNADILPGPGGEEGDKMKPEFDPYEFMDLLTKFSWTKATTLSIGWTSSLHDIHAPYTSEMIDEMLTLLTKYPRRKNITFPIRASSFRGSWTALRRLYDNNVDGDKNWTLTLWWSLTSEKYKLTNEEMSWFHSVLEHGKQSTLQNRTYYDVVNFPP